MKSLLLIILTLGLSIVGSRAGEVPLTWDSTSKEYSAKAGEENATFTFNLTNSSPGEVVSNWVRTSCGCTVAKLPPTPWHLSPGTNGQIGVTVDLRNKYGILTKFVTVDTSHGPMMLNVKVTVPQQQFASFPGAVDARTRNMELAKADRQAVFKNECASCHALPTLGRNGEALYNAACAVCHEAPHRATMVPDLQALKNPPTKDYWTQWITYGKPGSLMPAFAQSEGGPLTKDQIASLADYLTHYFPPRKISAEATPAVDD
jgi:mono/diheme cytochrome c family protein